MQHTQPAPNQHYAIQFHRYGGSDVLKLEEIPIPTIKEDEVLVKIKVAGVNPIDWKLREGMRSVPLPFIPGVEASGIIIRTGKNVSNWEVGQTVYGAIDHSYAQFATVKADHLFKKPSHLSFEEAAAVGGGKTAWGALFDVAGLEKGQRLLIQGASGGVGIFAVQLARQAGAYVIASASAKNGAALQRLGAHETIDYRSSDLETKIKEVDVVFDAVGGETLRKSYGLLKPGGVLVSIVEPPSPALAAEFGVKALWGGTKTLAAMTQIGRRLADGTLQPLVSKVFRKLYNAAAAQDCSMAGDKPMGKIVVTVD